MEQQQSLTLHVGENHPASTLHVPDSSMTLNDVLKVNGFTPRDGSFRFLVDEQGTMINHREASAAPSTVRYGVPANVEQLWIDEDAKRGFASAVRSNGDEVVVLNGKAFDFQTVFGQGGSAARNNDELLTAFHPSHPFIAPAIWSFFKSRPRARRGASTILKAVEWTVKFASKPLQQRLKPCEASGQRGNFNPTLKVRRFGRTLRRFR